MLGKAYLCQQINRQNNKGSYHINQVLQTQCLWANLVSDLLLRAKNGFCICQKPGSQSQSLKTVLFLY